MRGELFCVFVLRINSGPRVKICKSILNPPMVSATNHSKAVVLVLFLFVWLCGVESCLVLIFFQSC